MSTLPSQATVGRVLAGRYCMHRLIGRGGMGVVYLALDQWSGAEVVVKLLAPHWAGDAEAVDRFEREGMRLASLRHANIVEFYGHGDDAHDRFIVMEYVRGESLRHFLRRQNPLTLRTFAPIALQVLAAASYAHEQRLMLRDIKPSNIMLTEHEGRANFVKLLDFGLAKFAEGQEAEITKSYAVGTAGYLAPELIRGERGDLRVDVYALGVLFFRMLTGESPIVGDNDGALLYNHVHGEPRAMSSWLPQPHDIPESLIALITRCLAKDPAHRPSSAAEVRDGLVACVPLEAFALPPASAESRHAIESFEHQRPSGPHPSVAAQSGDTWKRAQVGPSRRRPTALMGPPPPPAGSGEFDALRVRGPGGEEVSATRVGSASFGEPHVWGPPSPAWPTPALASDEVEVQFDDADVEPTMLVPTPSRRSLMPLGAGVTLLSLVALGFTGFVVWSRSSSTASAESYAGSSPRSHATIQRDAPVVIEAPAHGWVRVDDRPRTVGPFHEPLTAGVHRVVVGAEGYEDWSLEFEVVGGTPVTLRPTLQPTPEGATDRNTAAVSVVVAPVPVPGADVSRAPLPPRPDANPRPERPQRRAVTKSAPKPDSNLPPPDKRDIFVPEKEQTAGVFLPVGNP